MGYIIVFILGLLGAGLYLRRNKWDGIIPPVAPDHNDLETPEVKPDEESSGSDLITPDLYG